MFNLFVSFSLGRKIDKHTQKWLKNTGIGTQETVHKHVKKIKKSYLNRHIATSCDRIVIVKLSNR